MYIVCMGSEKNCFEVVQAHNSFRIRIISRNLHVNAQAVFCPLVPSWVKFKGVRRFLHNFLSKQSVILNASPSLSKNGTKSSQTSKKKWCHSWIRCCHLSNPNKLSSHWRRNVLPFLSIGWGPDCGSLQFILHWYNLRNKQEWYLFSRWTLCTECTEWHSIIVIYIF